LGLMVLLTGILAFFSGTYAIYTAFASHEWAIVAALPLGLVYCTMIIAFDREIVGAQDKRAVLFRLPLAFVIGFIVSVPLELRLLEDSVNKRLNTASQEDNRLILDRLRSKEDELDTRKKELQDQIKHYRDEVAKWNAAMEAETVGRQLSGRTGIAGQGPAYREAERNRDAAQAFLTQYNTELTQHQSGESAERNRLRNEFKDNHIQQAWDFLARYQALDQLKENSSAAFAISWGLRILFILIEIFPALLKLLLPYNEYHAILEAMRRARVQLVHARGNEELRDLTANPPAYPQTSLLDILSSNPNP